MGLDVPVVVSVDAHVVAFAVLSFGAVASGDKLPQRLAAAVANSQQQQPQPPAAAATGAATEPFVGCVDGWLVVAMFTCIV